MDVGVYSLTPPQGYSCLGHVAVKSWRTNKPNLNNYRCVRKDYVGKITTYSQPEWNDDGSGADDDFAAYNIKSSSNRIKTGLFRSEKAHRWPITFWVDSLKKQTSVKCMENC